MTTFATWISYSIILELIYECLLQEYIGLGVSRTLGVDIECDICMDSFSAFNKCFSQIVIPDFPQKVATVCTHLGQLCSET